MQLAMQPQPTITPPDPAFPKPELSLEKAFDAHHAVIFRTAYRITGNAHDAEDVLQTVFLRLAASHAVDTIDNPESYLRRAAVNASLNLLEAHARKNIPLESAPEPHARSDQRDLREVLRHAMATLGGRTAEMFTLRFIEGHSNSEIADMFSVSALVVAVTLHRARKQLQKQITLLGGLK